jgi:DNA-3-methyladenine glycosylase II
MSGRAKAARAVLPPVIDTEDDLSAGLAGLVRAEPLFARALEIGGRPPLRRRAASLASLLEIIVAQQVSKASAAAIWLRMETVLAPLTAERLATATDDDYRAAGLSRPKVRTMRAIADAMLSGGLGFDRLAALEDAQVHAHLTAVKGIGPWTADIYLLSCLGRADAWPAGDLALQVAAGELLGLDTRPDAKAMTALSEPWRPWRGVAARCLWSYYGATRSRDVIP